MKSMLRKCMGSVIVLAAWTVWAADPAGRVVGIEGDVTARSGGAAARALALKSDVFTGDTIATGPGCKVQILFSDESIFSQGENTETTIDEFVYDPEKPASSTFAVRTVRGTFRAISGGISEINPDRFRIKTGRAAIGVRGCGLAGMLDDQRDEFLVDDPGLRQGVIIEPLVGGGRGALEFFEPGHALIDDGGRTTQGPFDADRFVILLNAVTPRQSGPGALRGGSDWSPLLHIGQRSDGESPLDSISLLDGGAPFQSPRLGLPYGTPGGGSGGTGRDGESPSQDPAAPLPRQWDYSGYAGAVAAYSHPDYGGMYPVYYSTCSSLNGAAYQQENEDVNVSVSLKELSIPPVNMQLSLYDLMESSTPMLTLDNPDTTTLQGGDRFTSSHGDPPDALVYENYPGGADWVWGEWALDGYGYAERGILVAGRTLPATDIDALRDGTTLYNLASDPVGQAHAWVGGSGGGRSMSGTANLSVTLGQGTASWSGQFSLNNANHDSLSFTVPVTPLSPGGHLRGDTVSYELNYDSVAYSQPDVSVFTGSLVGPGVNGDGRPPVTGAIGTVRFEHSDGPTVVMTYGTDVK